MPSDGTHVYLTDTLESPNTPPPTLPFYLQPIADQHAKALKVKAKVPVIVCLGNPPYDRHEAADETNKARTGGWVRWGDEGTGYEAILRSFLEPAINAGHGGDLKNAYNLYVYFWRWALWKVFEHTSAKGPGIVSFISGSSYLGSNALCGMREEMRRLCDEIWILDLGGEGRGTRQDENVFTIRTPVAIAVAASLGNSTKERPATVCYARINGTQEKKLSSLDSIADLESVEWEECPNEWHAPFLPAGEGSYFDWPLLIDLMPWQHSGAQFKRKWPISPDQSVLDARWDALLRSADRATAFKETRDRKIVKSYRPLRSDEERAAPICELKRDAAAPLVERCAYRSFDRQWIFADSRLGDFLRPELWSAHSQRQIYLTSLLTKPLGIGPGATACVEVPDLDCFSGRGAKDVIPLYSDSDCNEPNIQPGMLELLTKAYKKEVTAEDFLAYVYGILAQPAFTEKYAEELATRELRVPLTRDAGLFKKVREIGAKLLWLHTYGERFVPKGKHRGRVPRGKARCKTAVPGDLAGYPEKYEYNESTKSLHVGDGRFAPVEPDVYNFEVSGLKVVQSWLGYRMKNPKGRKSSPLDEITPARWSGQFTTELLELIWVLEGTIATYPAQEKLLKEVVKKATLPL